MPREARTTSMGHAWHAAVLELMIPKRAAYLTELYRFLGEAIRLDPGFETEATAPPMRLDGYSVYEVDGAYRGAEKSYEERVMVVRLILPRAKTRGRLRAFGKRLLEIAGFREEEVWILEYSGARVHSFAPPVES